MKTRHRMRREYNSCVDLSRKGALYDDQSMDSVNQHVEMNPNGHDTEEYTLYPQGSQLLMRQHNFKLKSYYTNVGNCTHCNKRIRFGVPSLKCRDCPLRCHPECCQHLYVNCMPQPRISTRRGHLSDYVPKTSPMVPALIVHCVTELEARGLDQEGLYRVPSTREKVKRLKQKLLGGRTTPYLGNKDSFTLSCCVKDFLRKLQRPLIPMEHRSDFIFATKLTDPLEVEEQLYLAMVDLQQAHRDTLAFLLLHLQRIAENPAVKMSINNIAIIFAPTLFDDVDLNLNNLAALQQVLRVLLQQSPGFWAQFLDVEQLTPACSVDTTEWTRESNQSPSLDWQSIKTYFRSMINLID